jgi:uncharacterized protein (DUF427 family)
MKASWKGQLLAESDDTVVVESNHYFPISSINREFFTKSDTTTRCPWKGDASYFSIVVDGHENPDAAWYYPTPMAAAQEIEGRVAFWRGVEVSE